MKKFSKTIVINGKTTPSNLNPEGYSNESFNFLAMPLARNFFKKIPVEFWLFALALALRLWHLGKQSLWMDEGFSVWVASHSLHEIMLLLPSDAHPPLFYLFLHFWMRFGRSEAFLRLPFAFISAFSAVIIYKLGQKYYSQTIGLLSGLFWAVSLEALRSDTQVRMYGIATCFGLIATWYFLKAYENSSFSNWLKYFLTGVLCIYTHYFTGFILITHLFFLLIRKQWRTALLLSLAFTIAFTPWSSIFFYQLQKAGKELPKPGWDTFYFLSMLSGIYRLLTHTNQELFVSIFSFCMILLSTVMTILQRKEYQLLLALEFYLPFILPFAFSNITKHHILMFRYTLIFAPYFALLLLDGLTKLPKIFSLPLVSVLLLANFGFWSLVISGTGYDTQPWKNVTQTLKIKLTPHDGVFVEQFLALMPLWYYLPQKFEIQFFDTEGLQGVAVFPTAGESTFWMPVGKNTPPEALKGPCNLTKRQWLILSQEEGDDPNEKILHWFLKNQQLVSIQNFYSLDPGEVIHVLLFKSRAHSHALPHKKLNSRVYIKL